jgi:hypothetical protein
MPREGSHQGKENTNVMRSDGDSTLVDHFIMFAALRRAKENDQNREAVV